MSLLYMALKRFWISSRSDLVPVTPRVMAISAKRAILGVMTDVSGALIGCHDCMSLPRRWGLATPQCTHNGLVLNLLQTFDGLAGAVEVQKLVQDALDLALQDIGRHLRWRRRGTGRLFASVRRCVALVASIRLGRALGAPTGGGGRRTAALGICAAGAGCARGRLAALQDRQSRRCRPGPARLWKFGEGRV